MQASTNSPESSASWAACIQATEGLRRTAAGLEGAEDASGDPWRTKSCCSCDRNTGKADLFSLRAWLMLETKPAASLCCSAA